MTYEIELKLKQAKDARPVTPENTEQLLREAALGVALAAERIDAIEAMSRTELVRNAEEILDFYARVNRAFSFQRPEGKGHEPHVVAWMQWQQVNALPFMEQYAKIIDAAPNNAVNRLEAIVESLPAAIVAERASILSLTGRDPATSPAGLRGLCDLLGLADCTATAAAGRIAAKVAEWEAAPPLALAKEKPTIFGVHSAIESALMFSPVAIAVSNGKPIPRPSKDWYEDLVIAMGGGLIERFMKILGLCVRAVMAQDLVSTTNEGAANARWDRLGKAQERAFEIRRNNPAPSRAKVIRGMVAEIRELAREAGEPLTGDDPAVIDTITRWFRKAKIK